MGRKSWIYTQRKAELTEVGIIIGVQLKLGVPLDGIAYIMRAVVAKWVVEIK